MKSLTLAEIVERFGCVIHEHSGAGNPALLTGISTLSAATSTQITFFNNPRYLAEALVTRAGVVLCGANEAKQLLTESRQSSNNAFSSIILVCRNPYATFARVSQFFFEPAHATHGVSPQAYIDVTAVIDETASVFPFVYVGPGARIGARTVLYPGSFIGAAAVLGDDCLVHPNAVVREGCRLGDRCILNPGAVIGGDGFGFAPDGAENVKIPQVGGVALGNDVEVGSNSSVDRGAMLDTIIGEQTKIDSLVQIGHNAVVGKACFLAAGTGVGGSSHIGNRVTLAGQVGVVGHIKIADNITILAQAGVTKSLQEPGVYSGFPARPNREQLSFDASLVRIVKEYREAKASRRETIKSEEN
jgi:UDP-3-O-[3-hydroxymyristoyl] glucosamine N-acyltransferase